MDTISTLYITLYYRLQLQNNILAHSFAIGFNLFVFSCNSSYAVLTLAMTRNSPSDYEVRGNQKYPETHPKKQSESAGRTEEHLENAENNEENSEYSKSKTLINL